MNDRSAYPAHADLLAQVATSEAEEREVRRILAPLTDAELSARNTARLGEVESAVAAYQRAPWPIAPATDAHRYSTCSGPCERGSRSCPAPEACECATEEQRPSFVRSLRDFIAVYRLYRRAHPPMYAARIAWGCAVRGLPF